MNKAFRSLLFLLSLALGTASFAQPTPPYDVSVYGTVAGCAANAFNYVIIATVPGTEPALDIEVQIDANCMFFVTLPMESLDGAYTVTVPCGDSTVASIFSYTVDPVFPDSTLVLVELNCNSTVCSACIDMDNPASFTAVYSSCSSGGTAPYTYLWDFSDAGAEPGNPVTHIYSGPGEYTVCLNVTDANGDLCSTCETVYVDANGGVSFNQPTSCQVCFNITQTGAGPNGGGTPWNIDLTNCSAGGVPPYSYQWSFPDGSASTLPDANFVFAAEGSYIICLTMSDANGCTSAECDSVYIDANGLISNTPTWTYDCLQILNGPNVPGNPCTVLGTGDQGTWNTDCECLPNGALPCQADFWVMQAYTNDSTNIPGGVEPIPFELWVWNLSSGGTGNYQFVWDFGDGTTSTEAFPTHVYPASGPYDLCLTMTDDAGCTSTSCQVIEVDQDGILGMGIGFDVRSVLTIRVIQQLPTSIPERSALEATTLWPNPVVEQLSLTLNSSRSGNLTLSIVDLSGREVSRSNASVAAGNNMLPLDVHELKAGMYVLRLMNGSNSASIRFVKQ